MRFVKSFATLCSLVGLAAAQSSSQICDSTNGICFEGYQDPTLDIFVGLVLPPLTTPPATEYIVQIVAPVSYGWTGVSMAGTMADALLFVLWPNGDDIILSTRWTDDYIQPVPYAGPTITMLPGSEVNSTHIKATFRCQNCTTWEDGAFDPTGAFQLLAYVTSTTTPVDDPTDPNSDFLEHDEFDFFGMITPDAISPNYESYISGGSSSAAPSSTAAPPSTTAAPPSTTAAPSSTTISAPGATQTKYGQCGGQGWTGPTACAPGSTCVAVSPPYYSQCS